MEQPSIELQRRLLAAARKAAEASYSPYSQFPVGAALWNGETETIYTGCNVENAAYPLGLCAERTAIVKAVSDGYKGPLTLLAVTAPKAKPCYPCGACLQVMREFGADLQVIFESADGEPVLLPLKALLPYSFSNADLPSA